MQTEVLGRFRSQTRESPSAGESARGLHVKVEPAGSQDGQVRELTSAQAKDTCENRAGSPLASRVGQEWTRDSAKSI